MRIALVFASFSERSSYIETPLSKALARLGHDVHVITSGLQQNYHLANYSKDFAGAFGAQLQPPGTSILEGVVVHRLAHRIIRGHVALRGLGRTLRELAPDIVQTGTVIAWPTITCAVHQPLRRFRLFTGAHQAKEIAYTTRGKAGQSRLHRSLAIAGRFIPGRMVSAVTEKCYAVTADAAEVARDLYGVQQRKIEVAPLGFDSNWFHLPTHHQDTEARIALRTSLGIGEADIVCIYTGRFDEIKNPHFLALAITELRRGGLPFRGLFVGGGIQAEEISQSDGAVVHPYIPADQLARLYWAADIAVWPRGYSASQVEAIACGLPVVMTDESQKVELDAYVQKYKQLDLRSMMETLRSLAPVDARNANRITNAEMVRDTLSWDVIARRRSADYESALQRVARPSRR